MEPSDEPDDPDESDRTHAAEDATVPEASDVASTALAHQRVAHADDSVDVDESGVGALVNNTGLDGDAATG